MLLGISLFIVLKNLFNNITFDSLKINKVLDISDSVSYVFYLVHHFIIIGPLSLMNLTGSIITNILIVLILTFVFAYFINYVSRIVKVF